MNAVDTNVWIYSHDARDPVKQATAKRVITTARPMALPWQVGCEFLAATRKLEPYGFSRDDAWDALTDMQSFASLLLPVPDLWPATRQFQSRFSLSIWDALLVAACIRGGVHTLYSEDFGGTPVINGMTIINPFAIP